MGDKEQARRFLHYTPAGWKAQPADAVKLNADKSHYEEAKRRLGCGDEKFLSHVVYSLTWGLRDAAAAIEGIYCDQWCGVSVVGGADVEDDSYSVWVECDEPEWGVAAAWIAFADRYGVRESDG